MDKTKSALKNLDDWSKSLNNAIQIYGPQILEALNKNTELPKDCPSRASLADLALNKILEKLSEVNASLKHLNNCIWEEGKN